MNFSDISGHRLQIQMLQQDILNRRFAGAYLFTGPEAIGKFMVAGAFAKALVCQRKETEGCGSCASCIKAQNGQHPDIHVIDRGYCDEITVEDIRQLQSAMGLRPYEARLKVFLVNNAHTMNQVSGNAFLKTLEEPAKDSVIVLVTDKPNLLLATIVSRCRRVKFHPLSRMQLQQRLSRDHALSAEMLEALSCMCDGRLGLAVRLKESDYLAQKNRIIDAFTLGSDPQLETMLASNRESLRWSLQVLVGWFRDLYMCKAGLQQGYINADRSDSIRRRAGSFSYEDLDGIIATLMESLRYNEHTINSKLLLANLKNCLRQG